MDRFREDPDCRVFLSTDAGSTGLNLQHASTLINMDLPWNPAILEQRIARIHRMGQKQPVQIVNFVSKGSIEEGMLSVLAFKRSLSAGILDGGTGEISLGGSRLNRFMKDVEKVTGQMGEGEAMPAEEAQAVQAAAAADTRAEDAPPAVDSIPTPMDTADAPQPDAVAHSGAAALQPGQAEPWSALLQVGMQFLAALATPDDGNDTNSTNAASHPWIAKDPQTGVRSLKLPLPPPETANRLADALSAVANALRKG